MVDHETEKIAIRDGRKTIKRLRVLPVNHVGVQFHFGACRRKFLRAGERDVNLVAEAIKLYDGVERSGGNESAFDGGDHDEVSAAAVDYFKPSTSCMS